MKKLILSLLFAAVCMCGQAWASTAEELYQNGQYAQALSAYEQQLKDYPNNPFLYYNIGNCYFKMGSRGLAIANYYRAFELNPRDADIRHNLELALSGSGESLVPPGMPQALHRSFFVLSVTELKGLLWACAWLFCLLAGVWLLTRKAGKLTVVAGVLLLLVAGWFYIRHSWQSEPLAVVASPKAELRSGPGTNFPASATVTQGHLVQVTDQKGTWQQVVLRGEGLKGWMEASALEHI